MIRFKTTAAAEFSMFDADARRLIGLMGHMDTPRGALAAEDVPEALQRLRAGIAANEAELATASQHHPQDEQNEQDADEHAGQEPVTLAHRAYPLIQMLEAAAAEDKPVLWES